MSGTNLVLARASAPAQNHTNESNKKRLAFGYIGYVLFYFFTIAEKNTYETRKDAFKFE